MQIAMIGLGRMGGNRARRLMADGHKCVVYDRDPEQVERLVSEGAVRLVNDLEAMCPAYTLDGRD